MITQITLTDFRNHKTSRITTGGGSNIIITGPNGAGKTAVLEAVSMLSGDRGMRGAPMGDVARFGTNTGFSIFAVLDDDTEISLIYPGGDANRRAKIDGDNAALTDLAQHLRIVWISPREDRIFVDAASERRVFFDRLVGATHASHPGRTARLAKLLSERAFALKMGRDNYWLDAIDTQIAGVAVAVADMRMRYAGEINYFLDDAAVSVDGLVEGWLISGTPAGDAERKYLEYLKSNRTLSGDKMILDGPHRADFGVFNKTLNLPANLTSTGQQKTVLLDLILAHAKLVHTKTNAHPIILLDEAAAHLDTSARQHLFNALSAASAQVWATGLDANVFTNIKNVTFVTCTDGQINNILTPEKEKTDNEQN